MTEEESKAKAEKDFQSRKPLSLEMLQKMNASRLLAYSKKWRKIYHRVQNSFFCDTCWDYHRSNGDSWEGEPEIALAPINAYIKTIKEILNTKPHVERPGKPKKEKKDSNKRRK